MTSPSLSAPLRLHCWPVRMRLCWRRHTGQSGIVLATPALGRTGADVERAVGYFNDITILRLQLEPDLDAASLAGLVKERVIRALDWQGVPFQDIASLPETRTVRLTNALFGLTEFETKGIALKGADTERLELDFGGSDFRIGWFLNRGDTYRGVIRFDSRTVCRKSLETLAKRYCELLERLVKEPTTTLRALPRYEDTPSQSRSETLRAPEQTRVPASLLEAKLTEIWSNLFDHPVKVHDNFFELGGHSLLAARLMSEIEQQVTGERMPLAMLFDSPTISLMSKAIAGLGWQDSWRCLVPIQPQGSKRPLFFVHGHGGNVLGFHALGREIDPERPFFALQAPDLRKENASCPKGRSAS